MLNNSSHWSNITSHYFSQEVYPCVPEPAVLWTFCACLHSVKGTGWTGVALPDYVCRIRFVPLQHTGGGGGGKGEMQRRMKERGNAV